MTDEERDLKLMELMTKHQRSVYGFIFTMVGNAADADDVLQNTYLIMWKKRADFHGKGNFLTWACSFAKLQVFSYRKKHKRHRQHAVEEEVLDAIASEVERQFDDREDRLLALRSCLASLPERQRELLTLRYFESKSSAAIADLRDTSENVIHVTMHRVRKALLRCIRTKMTATGAA